MNTITQTSTPDEVTHALDTPCDGYPPFLPLEGSWRGMWCKLVSVEGVEI